MKKTARSFGILSLCVLLNGCGTLESVRPEGLSFVGNGVSFDARRNLLEPEQTPAYVPFAYDELKRIEEVPTELEFDICAETSQITKTMMWGTVENVGAMPSGSVIRKQFVNALSEHFHPIDDDRQPVVKITVRPCMIVTKKTASDRASCDAEFKITMTDVAKSQILFEETYRHFSEDAWDGVSVPAAVYKSVQGAAADFLKALSRKSGLIARLEGTSAGGDVAKKPDFIDYLMRPGREDGVFSGICKVSCNDWDSVRTANWMRNQLEKRCCEQLGIEKSRVRVIYEENRFDAETKVWTVSFRAFARSAWVLDYDATSRAGMCVADLALVGKSAADAADVMKSYVLQEMDRRAGTVASGVASGRAQVRFADFKTDTRYNLIRCTFKLVY